MFDRNIQKSKLNVGVAQVDITPWADVNLAGAVGVRRRARAILDPLFARAIVFDNGTRKLCLITGDLTIITRKAGDTIRDMVARRFGFDRDAIIVHLTQTHTAPSLGNFMLDQDFANIPEKYDWLRGGDSRYTEFAIEKFVEAIGLAVENLQPVEVGITSALEGRLAFNRRGISKDGKVIMPPRKWADMRGCADILYLEGPMDPQVLMMCFQTVDLKIPAAILHYSCHPVHVFPKQLISADWPGAWCDGVRELFGGECTPLVVNGCCGNLNPWDPWDPDYPDDHVRMGRILTERCRDVLEFIKFSDSDTLSYRSVHFKIPYRQVPEDVLAEAKQYLAEHLDIVWKDDSHTSVDMEWYKRAMMVSIDLEQKREGAMDYEIQVCRIGDIAMVALPGEPFVEGQLKIKLNSPAKYTFVMHMTSHYVGYIPTFEAMKRGGHETTLSTWSKLVPQALDMIVDTSIDLLKEVFKK